MEPTGPLIRDIWMNDFEAFLEAMRSRTRLERHRFLSMFCICLAAIPKFYAGRLKIGHESLA